MFELLEENQPEEQKPTDYTGVIIGASLIPVYIFFVHIDKPDMGLEVCVYLGMISLAIKIRWDLRTRFWFWAVVVLVLALHVFLLLKLRWPHFTVSRVSLLPIGLADLLVILGIIQFVEKFIVRTAPADDE